MYNLSMLTTKADCTAVLNIATPAKESLVYRKTGLQRKNQSASLNSQEIQASLVAVTAEIEALETVLDNLPPGDVYDANEVRLRKAEHKKFLLEQRKINYGPVAQADGIYEINCLDGEIAETDAFIAALVARRDELPA